MDYVKKSIEYMKENAESELRGMMERREMLKEQLGKVEADIADQKEKIEQYDEFLKGKSVAQQLVAQITVNAEDISKEIVKRLHGQNKRPGCL